MTSLNPILIVGAGPVGLTLAILLRDFGVPVRIVDRAASASDTTRAIAVHSRTLEVLDELGVAERFLSAGIAIKRFRVQHRSRCILEYGFDRLEARYPLLLSLPQSETERLLEERLLELGGHIERSTELVSISQTDAEVEAVLQTPSGAERVRAPWVVGCDGAHSKLRQSLGLEFSGKEYHRFFMLADVDVEGENIRDQGMFFLGSGEGYLGLAPLPGERRHRMFVELPFELPEKRPPLDLSTFQQMVSDRGYPFRLSNPSSMTMGEFRQRTVNRLRVGRVFLAGDAAHIGSPIGGQYMNLGLNEAHNLAWKLCWLQKGYARENLIDSYEVERLKVAREAEQTAHLLTKLFTLTNRGALLLRNYALPWMSRLRAAQERLPRGVSGHAFDYVGTGAVADQCRGPSRPVSGREVGGLRAGKLAPDPTLPGESRRLLAQRTGPHALLLLFSGQLASASRWDLLFKIARGIERDFEPLIIPRVVWLGEAPRRSDALVLEDRDGQIHQHYRAQRGAMYLIRPDGFIGYSGPDGIEADLRRYLECQLHLEAPRALPSRLPRNTASNDALRAS